MGVTIVRVENFCCKWSLRHGTMFIGCLATFLSLCYFIFACVSAVTGDQPPEHYKVAIPSSLSGLIIDSLLFYGAIRESHVFLLPYLVLLGAILIVLCYLILILSILYPIVLVFYLALVPASYCWLIVYSYYQSLVSDTVIPNPTMVAYKDTITMEPTKYPEVV